MDLASAGERRPHPSRRLVVSHGMRATKELPVASLRPRASGQNASLGNARWSARSLSGQVGRISGGSADVALPCAGCIGEKLGNVAHGHIGP